VAQTLLQRGWTNVHPLIGGFDAWQNAGYPLEARTQPLSAVAENIRNAEGDEEEAQ
jgi:3-mercaptopyruvate sulfurtransferase SseA